MTSGDLIIIGAGPAGLTAAQYGARANLKVIVIEQLMPGGQAANINILENYPGNVEVLDTEGNIIAHVKSGYDFAMDLHKQALNFGAEFLFTSVMSINKENDFFILSMADGSEKKARAVIYAAGAKPKPLGVPGEDKFFGKGVSYCAACDGNFFKGKKIFVVGGGDAACDGARYLSKLTDKVTLIHRRGDFRAQKALAERTMNNPSIKIRFNTAVKEIKGRAKAESAVLADTVNGALYEEETDAVFIFVGVKPQSSLAGSLNAALDENGFVITDSGMSTNVPGFFAAGDIRSGVFRQVITAAADGAIAAHSASEYIWNMEQGTGNGE
ncbi:MAG: thioredoxin-disulfide reductase [Treponema sp.]|nr:thioredoxin-disulfide reductase [Treponema sp.]